MEFQALIEQWQETQSLKFLRAGTIAAAAVNPHLDRKRQPRLLTAYDFFNIPRPEPKPEPAAVRLKKMDAFFKMQTERAHKLEAVRAKEKRAK